MQLIPGDVRLRPFSTSFYLWYIYVHLNLDPFFQSSSHRPQLNQVKFYVVDDKVVGCLTFNHSCLQGMSKKSFSLAPSMKQLGQEIYYCIRSVNFQCSSRLKQYANLVTPTLITLRLKRNAEEQRNQFICNLISFLVVIALWVDLSEWKNYKVFTSRWNGNESRKLGDIKVANS